MNYRLGPRPQSRSVFLLGLPGSEAGRQWGTHACHVCPVLLGSRGGSRCGWVQRAAFCPDRVSTGYLRCKRSCLKSEEAHLNLACGVDWTASNLSA